MHIRLGSDCRGLGTAHLACEDIKEMKSWIIHRFASENDKATKKILELNNPTIQHIYDDMRDRALDSVPFVDLYIQTAPCQTYSMMGFMDLAQYMYQSIIQPLRAFRRTNLRKEATG